MPAALWLGPGIDLLPEPEERISPDRPTAAGFTPDQAREGISRRGSR